MGDTNIVDLEMTRGDTKVYDTYFNDENGNPVDDSSATYRITARDNTGNIIFSNTTHQYAPGRAWTVINPTDTSGLKTFDQGLDYDIQVTETSGRVTTIQEGILIVHPDVSLVTP